MFIPLKLRKTDPCSSRGMPVAGVQSSVTQEQAGVQLEVIFLSAVLIQIVPNWESVP